MPASYLLQWKTPSDEKNVWQLFSLKCMSDGGNKNNPRGTAASGRGEFFCYPTCRMALKKALVLLHSIAILSPLIWSLSDPLCVTEMSRKWQIKHFWVRGQDQPLNGWSFEAHLFFILSVTFLQLRETFKNLLSRLFPILVTVVLCCKCILVVFKLAFWWHFKIISSVT